MKKLQFFFRTAVFSVCFVLSSSAMSSEGGGEATPSIKGFRFIGCRPSVGECYHSCSERRSARAIKDDPKCERNYYDTWGCYCRVAR